MFPLRDNVPKDRFPAVTLALLAANVLAFFLVQDASLSLVPDGELLQLGANLLALWILGPSVEDTLGRARFLGLYVLGGLAALGLQAAVDPGSTGSAIGATGAIAGVLGAYAVLLPRARVLALVLVPFFFTIVELPAQWVVAAFVLIQVLLGVGDLAATVGGFVFGLLAALLLAQRRREVPPRLARRAPWA